MKQRIFLIATLFALGGCTLWWGADYHLVDGTQDYVKYEYELASVNETSMGDAATKYCKKFGKKSVKGPMEEGGYEYITTYYCVPQTAVVVTQPQGL